MLMRRIQLLHTLSVLLGVVLVACGQQGAPSSGGGSQGGKPGGLRVAMMLPGPVQDADFNMLGARALDRIKTETGAETTLSESVSVADAERVAREYLNSGFNVVLFHGAQYLTIVQKLAPAFSPSRFVIVSSAPASDLPPNVWSIDRKLYRGFYPLGVLAASSTKSKKLGYLSGVRLPEFIGALNAMKQGIQDTTPDAQVVNAFVGDQNDPVKARGAAASQLNSGVDFIVATVNLGVNGVAEAVKASPQPALFTTFYTGKQELAPQHLAGSLLVDFGPPYLQAMREIQQEAKGGVVIEMRPGSGLELSEIRNVPPEAATKVRAAWDAIASGQKEIHEVNDRVVE